MTNCQLSHANIALGIELQYFLSTDKNVFSQIPKSSWLFVVKQNSNNTFKKVGLFCYTEKKFFVEKYLHWKGIVLVQSPKRRHHIGNNISIINIIVTNCTWIGRDPAAFTTRFFLSKAALPVSVKPKICCQHQNAISR